MTNVYKTDQQMIWSDKKGINRPNDEPAMILVNTEWLSRQNMCDSYVDTQPYNADKYWYRNNKLHRSDNLPAIEMANGTKEYYLDNKLHRGYDLPAIERADGTKEWWFNGKRENKKIVDKRREKDIYNIRLVFEAKLPRYNLTCGPILDVIKFI